MDASKKIIKDVRKKLGIPENMGDKFYKLASNKYAKLQVNTVFITQDATGAIVELSKKKAPFVAGQLLYSQIKENSKSSTRSKEIKSAKTDKKLKNLKPCPPGKIRNPETGRCVSEAKQVKKTKK